MIPLHDPMRHSFASDNASGVHPEVLAALATANTGHVPGYGADPYTAELVERFRTMLGVQTEVLPVLTGTGANIVALRSMLPRWGAVITADSAHIHTDEGGAAERTGLKLLTVDAPEGKLTPELIDREAWGWGNVHRAQPLAVALTQPTERGAVYSVDEIRAICEHAHASGMRVYMDGARIANAVAALEVPLRALTVDAGVDVFSFGGTKNGALSAEAIVVLTKDAAPGIEFERKALMHLTSKMRFVSTQLLALLEDDLWLRSARHANTMAQRLRDGVSAAIRTGRARGVELTGTGTANAVFARMPGDVADQLRSRFAFHGGGRHASTVRWMCSFDTTPADVDELIGELIRLTGCDASAPNT